MRVRRIAVRNLFGIFNHEIPLNLDDHITIIHGPNGFGKTVVLRLLNSFFTSQYQQLREVRFDSLTISLDDESEVIITNAGLQEGAVEETNSIKKAANPPEGGLTMRYVPKEGKPQHFTVKRITPEGLGFPIGILDRGVPGLERVAAETWLYEPTQERLSLEEVFERFSDRLPVSGRKAREPEWLQKVKKSVSIRFIETQRLLLFGVGRRQREFQRMYDRQLPLVSAVSNYSDELVSAIQGKLAEYAALSQRLDRSFPTRLVKGSLAGDLTIEELRTNLQRLEEKRTQLMAAGLLDKEGEVDLIDFQAIGENNRNVLSVYIDDVSQKLAVFDELTLKIDLMVRIINSRFTYKKMSVSKKSGFVFHTTLDGNELRSTGLSSGEQHELVLFYELLFRVSPNSLILIDEPELSLHVLWQQQFLKDLQEVIRLSEFDVLIATHSPQIINDRWDLTVELKGPVDAAVSHSQ